MLGILLVEMRTVAQGETVKGSRKIVKGDEFIE